jgi:hypothetical membrane protein
MTTIGIATERSSGSAAPAVASARSRNRLQDNMLVCGALAALVYLVTDILGSLRYPGYDFTSQGVSELMAVGAPTKTLVDSIFIVYGLLAIAFAIGVIREASPGRRALRITGAVLLAYAAIPMVVAGRFAAYPRGAGAFSESVPHIILTAVLVVLMLASIGFGAFALGRRFRIYSFATLGVLIALGAVSGYYGARLAAGQSTPGFGVVERVLIYAFLAWAATLGISLLRSAHASSEASP